jgi:hypothetical protein
MRHNGTVNDNVWTADHGADHPADDRARRSSHCGAGASTDGYAFQCPRLRPDRGGRQQQHDESSFERSSHDQSPLFIPRCRQQRASGGGVPAAAMRGPLPYPSAA